MWRKLTLSILKVQKEAIAQNLCWENFHDLIRHADGSLWK